MITIRVAKPAEAQLITNIAISSKAFWGYDRAFMQLCVDELSHTPDDIACDRFIYCVATSNERVVGFYKLEGVDEESVVLEALFVSPEAIGHGVGAKLFAHAKYTACKLGGLDLHVQSDPNAEKFYHKMGGKTVGYTESGSMPGRLLPQITFILNGDQ